MYYDPSYSRHSCANSAGRDRKRVLSKKKHGISMRDFAAIINCAARLAPAVLMLCWTISREAKAFEPDAVIAGEDARICEDSNFRCEPSPRTMEEIAQARAYVVETAEPGYTMTLQGTDVAIGRLHPEFVVRVANAIREARNAGLPTARVFSAYRPPAFGVGGFSDKFKSLHSYGLAVDMGGIGTPGSSEAQLWHQIAARNGIVCPYGPRNRAEWNHCQPTSVKMISPKNPLRETVSASGPFDVDSMFEAGNAVIESMASAAASLSKTIPAAVRAVEAVAYRAEQQPESVRHRRMKRKSRNALHRAGTKSVRHLRGGLRAGV